MAPKPRYFYLVWLIYSICTPIINDHILNCFQTVPRTAFAHLKSLCLPVSPAPPPSPDRVYQRYGTVYLESGWNESVKASFRWRKRREQFFVEKKHTKNKETNKKTGDTQPFNIKPNSILFQRDSKRERERGERDRERERERVREGRQRNRDPTLNYTISDPRMISQWLLCFCDDLLFFFPTLDHNSSTSTIQTVPNTSEPPLWPMVSAQRKQTSSTDGQFCRQTDTHPTFKVGSLALGKLTPSWFESVNVGSVMV